MLQHVLRWLGIRSCLCQGRVELGLADGHPWSFKPGLPVDVTQVLIFEITKEIIFELVAVNRLELEVVVVGLQERFHLGCK